MSMSFGMLHQFLSQPPLAMRCADNERAKQCVRTVQLHTDDSKWGAGWPDMEKVGHVLIRQIRRWQARAFQQAEYGSVPGGLVDLQHGFHG